MNELTDEQLDEKLDEIIFFFETFDYSMDRAVLDVTLESYSEFFEHYHPRLSTKFVDKTAHAIWKWYRAGGYLSETFEEWIQKQMQESGMDPLFNIIFTLLTNALHRINGCKADIWHIMYLTVYGEGHINIRVFSSNTQSMLFSDNIIDENSLMIQLGQTKDFPNIDDFDENLPEIEELTHKILKQYHTKLTEMNK